VKNRQHPAMDRVVEALHSLAMDRVAESFRGEVLLQHQPCCHVSQRQISRDLERMGWASGLRSD
jgi:hypothetical protein